MNKESHKIPKSQNHASIFISTAPPPILSQECALSPSSTFHGHLFILKRRLPTGLKFLAHKMIETVSIYNSHLQGEHLEHIQ